MALSDGVGGATGAGLAETIAWQIGTTTYALEGNILATGATVRWMAELLGCTPSELHELATTVTTPSEVTVVPAFSGLGAPWWDPAARGLIANLDLATGRADLARAAFEAIAQQIEDVVEAVVSATGTDVETIAADGGPSANDWLMQLQADTSQRAVVRSVAPDLSALGVAGLAATTVGVRPSSVDPVEVAGTRFEPGRAADAARRRQVWADALARARSAPNVERGST
jgi:glycerol kinase